MVFNFILFLIAVSLCTGHHSNEDNIVYSTFDRIISREVPIKSVTIRLPSFLTIRNFRTVVDCINFLKT